LVAGTPLTAGKATITWTHKETKKGGNNEAPTFSDEITAKCGTAAGQIYRDETEGSETKLTVRTVGDHAIVELFQHRAREGENSDSAGAFVFDTAACKTL